MSCCSSCTGSRQPDNSKGATSSGDTPSSQVHNDNPLDPSRSPTRDQPSKATSITGQTTAHPLPATAPGTTAVTRPTNTPQDRLNDSQTTQAYEDQIQQGPLNDSQATQAYDDQLPQRPLHDSQATYAYDDQPQQGPLNDSQATQGYNDEPQQRPQKVRST